MRPIPQGQPHRLGVLKAASNAFVAAEQAVGEVGHKAVPRAFKNGFYAHRAEADRASGSRPGAKLLTTPAFN